MIKPVGHSQPQAADIFWMMRALELALHGQAQGEVPVGAILVRNERIIGEGWNRPIAEHDPTAHAEIIALRAAGTRLRNYRLLGTTLYTTLEPCAMCVGAIIHARVARVVFGAFDPKSGAAGSIFRLLQSDRFNHRPVCAGGVLAEESMALLREFFRGRR